MTTTTKHGMQTINEALIFDSTVYSVFYVKINRDYSSLLVERHSLTQTKDIQPVSYSCKGEEDDSIERCEE